MSDRLMRGLNDMFRFDFADETGRNADLDNSVDQATGAELVARLEGGVDGVFVCDIEA